MKHGDHWESIVEDIDKELVPIIKTTLKNSKPSEPKIYHYQEESMAFFWFSYPQTKVRYLTIAKIESEMGVTTVHSALPFCFEGTDIFLKINKIQFEKDTIEAILECSTEDGTLINFYDTLYFEQINIYMLDSFRKFRIAGIAYSLFKTKPGKTELFDSKTKEQILKRNETEEIKIPTEFSTENATQFYNPSILDKEKKSFNDDDYFFQSFIEEVSEFYLEDRKIYQMLISIDIVNDIPVKITLYAAEKIIEKGYIPKAGDNVYGYLWLQGYSTH